MKELILSLALASWCLILSDALIVTTPPNNVTCKTRQFPPNFLFGVSTSAYQIEGAWNVSDKLESVWDRLTHTNPQFTNNENGDVACDSYNKFVLDTQLMKRLGVKTYRFSISWGRIMPQGFGTVVNQAGIDHYNYVINTLLINGITPLVTMFHWDLPQILQDKGGFLNPDIQNWFADYARVLFKYFGDRVTLWTTFNEPYNWCHFGYGDPQAAPRVNSSGIGEYICSKNLLLAHAQAWHMYNDDFRKSQNGMVSITLGTAWFEPLTSSQDDVRAADENRKFELGIYAYPIYKREGDYPPIVKARIAVRSLQQGYNVSRLPVLSPTEINYIKGTADFFAINVYTTYYVYRNSSTIGIYPSPSYYDDLSVKAYVDPSWPRSTATWLYNVPWGMYKLIKYIQAEYNNPLIYICESGWADHDPINDQGTISFLRGYLDALLDAIYEGVQVMGYNVWSLMDNFEWTAGYSVRFGLHYVDFNDPARPRTPKASMAYYKNVIKTRTTCPNY